MRLCSFAGGEDSGYFAFNAGGRRFESCRQSAVVIGVAQWQSALDLSRWFPGRFTFRRWRR